VIPANSVLIFEVELVSIEAAKQGEEGQQQEPEQGRQQEQEQEQQQQEKQGKQQ
jgi:hypothetical protein